MPESLENTGFFESGTSLPLDHEFFHLNNFVWVIYHTVF